MHLLQTLPFTEPCDGCDHATEIMTATQGTYLVIYAETATPGDRVYCTSCDCSGTIEQDLIWRQYETEPVYRLEVVGHVAWGEMCAHCVQVLDHKMELLARHIRERLGCNSFLITREK